MIQACTWRGSDTLYRELTVSKDGNEQYDSIASAIKSVKYGDSAKIYIRKGVYKEKLIIDKPKITLIGDSPEDVIITYDDSAMKPDETGQPMGTFKTATVHATPEAEGFWAIGVTIENSAGIGSEVGQAVALYVDCDKAIIKNCRLLGRQDTLLAAPMHEEIDINPEIYNRQLFENCYIEGDVDFIFGGAVAVFKDCEIVALKREADYYCYVTAACTSKEIEFGYTLINCKFTGEAEKGTVYLGRPWREHANTVFLNCELGDVIHKQCFSKWNDTDRHKTCYYAQYGSYGEGYDEASVVDWSYLLTEEEASKYTFDEIFKEWIPKG